MRLIQDEDSDISIDLAVVVGMQHEIWALYTSCLDLLSLGEPQSHSDMTKMLKRKAVSVSGLEEFARKNDDIILQEAIKPDLVGMVRFTSRAATMAWRLLPSPIASARKPPLNDEFASHTNLPTPVLCQYLSSVLSSSKMLRCT
ncbi:hypothetical protein FNAPI_4646 [Fusarium napiforme]|uniref:Uncharacterized protein n=1 Tax=Fusarium napiforme TaxID=42672 RepID=A0A8H5JRY4_9HYPO|nr:hypothetical protein FNAPI_4646 [Fusarium napiforme]